MRDTLTPRIQRAAAMARMATDTLGGLDKVDIAVDLYRVGLITETECINKLRGV